MSISMNDESGSYFLFKGDKTAGLTTCNYGSIAERACVPDQDEVLLFTIATKRQKCLFIVLLFRTSCSHGFSSFVLVCYCSACKLITIALVASGILS